MGLACFGVTHCSECGTALSMQEYGMCKNCRKEQEKEKIKKQKLRQQMKCLKN